MIPPAPDDSGAAAAVLIAAPTVIPAWAHALRDGVAALRSARGSAREAPRARLWRLLHASLFASLRSQAGRIAPVSQEDLEDLASVKSSELMARAEAGVWDPVPHPPHEVAGFIRNVARNGLVDLARRRARECPPPEDEEMWDMAIADRLPQAPGPEDWACAREFVVALEHCVHGLTPRAREVWFLRACLERPSREIAALTGVTVANVDVIVMRARQALGECMSARGHQSTEVRPGAFAALWSESPLRAAWAAEGEA
jgi:RNA polymerase sigma factor (sigma-70 family)